MDGKRKKTGGRKKGTPNKSSMAFAAALESLDFSIPDHAVELFKSSQSDDLKLKILTFLAEYRHPKPKVMEPTSADQADQHEEMSPAQILNIVDQK